MKRRLKCVKCGSKNTKKKGKTSSGKQRYYCLDCKASFVIKRPDIKQRNYRVWFNKYLEGYTLKQISQLSGYSTSFLWKYINKQLNKPISNNVDLSEYKYLIFDGKYLFGRKYCLIVLMNAIDNKPIASKIVKSETRKYIEPWLKELKRNGLEPKSVTIDGLITVRKAFKTVFPEIIIQRCLFHIKLQIIAWIRIPPKTEPGRDLVNLIKGLTSINTTRQKSLFIQAYNNLILKHRQCFKELNNKIYTDNFRKHINYNKSNKDKYNSRKDITKIRTSTERDLIKAYNLIKTAYPNMFHYLKDNNIPITTSPLEGYFKQIQKLKGFDHCGLTKDNLFKLIEHKITYDFNKKNEK